MTYLIHHTDDTDDKPSEIPELDAQLVIRNNFDTEKGVAFQIARLHAGERVQIRSGYIVKKEEL